MPQCPVTDSEEGSPERLARAIVETCVRCGFCRDFRDEDMPCLFFPELFRLASEEANGEEATPGALGHLVDLCTMCGLCCCPRMRADVRRAKDAFVARGRPGRATRVLRNVQRIGSLGGTYPRLANALLENGHVARLLKAMAGIHPERQFPRFPPESFAAWAGARKLDRQRGGAGRKVAYFHGCMARFFPEEAKATVEVLEHNDVEVYLPEQKCCGMPSLLEGDRESTFSAARFNLERLAESVEDGYEVVCSCPTCGYVLKNLFAEGAHLSDEYRAWLGGKTEEELIAMARAGPSYVDDPFGRPPPGTPRRESPPPIMLILSGLIRDRSYFASLDGWKRLRVSQKTHDLGEYLRSLDRSGNLDRDLGPVRSRTAYYPPCHLKEQNIGQPWVELLGLVPGLSVKNVGGTFDCCGMGGVMGFKREFHDASLAVGSRLMKRIEEADPEKVLSDCLSCRIQFNQFLPYEACHPVEILRDSYDAHRRERSARAVDDRQVERR
jgi:glycerol-3-phosphate dehydrogenase subunit C